MDIEGINRINNKLIKHLKPRFIKFLHFFFNLRISFGIHPSDREIEKVILLHKASKPEDLVEGYRPLRLTSCLGKPLEKAVANILNNWAESKKKLTINNSKTVSEKEWAQMIIYSKFFKQLNLASIKVIQLQVSFLTSRSLVW